MARKFNTVVEAQILELYKSGKNTLEIGRELNIKYNTSIRRVLLRNGITPISTRERLEVVKTNPFADLTNPATQYWLGYLAADGCISKRKTTAEPSVVRVNTNTDPDHLLKYIEFLGSPVKRRESYNSRADVMEYCVGFSSLETCRFLTGLGYTPAKSLTFEAKFDFDWNFVRGYFDGNGYARKRQIQIVSGSSNFIYQLEAFYKNNGLDPLINKSRSCWLIDVFKLESRKLWAANTYGEDYQEDLCLTRKKEKVLDF